jgi:hypothetical protein
MAYTTQYFIEDQGKRKEKDPKQYSMQLDKQVSKQKIRDLAASCCTLSRAEKLKLLKLAVTSGRPRRYVQGWLPVVRGDSSSELSVTRRHRVISMADQPYGEQ